MADINGVGSSSSIFETINQTNADNSTAGSSSETSDTSEMFMQLMIAQLQNQSPTSPADTADFMQQISNMSTVESIIGLNDTMENLSSSLMTSQAALQASSMVGQSAFVKTDNGVVAEGSDVSGMVSLPISVSDARVKVYDSSGDLVDTLQLGPLASGDHQFTWKSDGFDDGNYTFVAEGQGDEGYETAESYIGHTISSVTLGQNGIGMTVNTTAGSISMSDVKQLGQG